MAYSEYTKILLPVKNEINEVENKLQKVSTSDNVKISPFLKQFVSAPSKKIRPLLCILFSKALYGTFTQKQLCCATAAELIHIASLIHDDIVDNSVKRRGLKTLNAMYDSRLAVLAGDYILSKAVETLSSINELVVFNIFAQAIKNITIAEINQYFFHFTQISLEEYIEKSKNKTAQLFGASVEAVLKVDSNAQNNKDKIKNAKNFALNFGIAFQIKDDLAALYKNSTLKTNNDAENGIYTPLMSLSIEKRRCLLDDYIERAACDIGFLKDSQYKTALLELLNYLRKFDE